MTITIGNIRLRGPLLAPVDGNWAGAGVDAGGEAGTADGSLSGFMAEDPFVCGRLFFSILSTRRRIVKEIVRVRFATVARAHACGWMKVRHRSAVADQQSQKYEHQFPCRPYAGMRCCNWSWLIASL